MDFNSPGEERIMAIDYGEKRVGLALCDPLRIFAYPFKTILNDRNFRTNLLSIIKENSVSLILLGYPLKENGMKTDVTEAVEKFKTELEGLAKLPVILRDERYTSAIAKERIIESVKSKKKRRDKGLLDKNAASIILQDYLDENPKKG
ncbi:MAG: Holliday junction resolvase RuvX [Bacteroidota bacterium]|jgi:putative Holliday junction resolvase|nr:Holliday junction resolvase RuvX [Ignavibacteria bacterium]MCU7499850.1 Holliday junction resolvase RuvX [Ignavibacteria bacterium]MCU7511851.1 Holliday junction resolvase RuvX [Ignavibacteria bacterium]MCU7519948.1 Holliday junction resolvase RuvX [Ignavibacteria bacterium]MCU7523023.1 Holliday junction resolvase RuvX [Ignavibacteria bacterium]